jgi:hypothetical protein
MKILLSHVEERRWLGVLSLSLPSEGGGEEEEFFFKVTIFPTSSTQEWMVSLTPTLFVELTEGEKLERAIRRGLVKLASQELTCSDQENFQSLLEKHPEVWEEVLSLLQKQRVSLSLSQEVRKREEVDNEDEKIEKHSPNPPNLEGGSLPQEAPLESNREGGEWEDSPTM